MKNLLTLTLMFLSALSFAQIVESEKVLVKTLDPQGASEIIFDFRHKGIDAETWDRESIRFQLEIHSNMPEAILSQLVKAGRYNLEGFKEGNIYYIIAPNLEKNVTVGGKTLEDEIFVHVQMPNYLELLGSTITVSKNLLVKGRSSEIRVPVDMNVEFKFIYDDATAVTSDPVLSSPETTITKDAGKTESTAAPTMERQAHFGEILIDGVKLEVE